MNFSEVYNLILESCPFLGGNSYDGIIVKKLAATNTISDTGSSHQSHMAFTGKQKDFFPFLEADGYFNVGYDSKDDDLKKYFTLRIPLNIYAENVNSLSQEHASIEFSSPKKIVRASVLRSRRKGQEDQVELSIKSLDDKDFIEFRKLLRINDFFVILKKQNVLEYDLIGISSSDKNAAVLATCTDFYKLTTQTPVDIDFFGDVKKDANESNILPFTPSQIIYYGVPGCGKSNKIREQLKDVPEKNKVRVVFHPEYTNAEFIGQILPKVNGHVTYEFTPGPFTQIIKRAYLNPNEQFYLVIEEINRGNAAAIFGDTFQLLDRLKAGETDSLGNDPANASVNTFTEGWSQYFVQNDDVNAYIRKATKLDDGSYQERNDGEPIEEIKIKEIHFNANTAIRLPPNLSILATMNTSDQNVFTLDNAFQRRFDMELVRNEFDLTQPAVNAQYNAEIDDTGIKWGQFWGWINAKITATLKGLSSTEDKRLGVWFVSNVGGIIDDKVFAEKVLKFLWDDVFKFKRPQVFAEGIDTLEKLINSFEKPSEGKERFDVFKDKANLVAFVASPTL
ncbi:dynein-related subfamily AAA family protein [Fibrobacter sp. UWS1]|nr:dynein-related subfamily AAA family protein [Fibrobacter sp. UWS1]